MDSDVVDLQAQGQTLRRRWRLIALMTILGLAAALALAYLQTPTYTASAQVLVGPLAAENPTTNGVVVPLEEVSTQISVLGSGPVAARVVRQLHLPETPAQLLKAVSVAAGTTTRVLTVTATRPNAQQAADIANAFATQYLSFRQQRAAAQATAQRQAYNNNFTALQNELAAVTSQLRTATGATRVSLQARKQSLLVQVTQAATQLALLNDPSVGSTSGGVVLQVAQVPKTPSAPRPVRLAILGALVGLLLGIGLAFLRDRVDDAVRDEDRLSEILEGRPVLGQIPHWSGSRSKRIATLVQPHSPVSEAYRALSTNVRFMLAASGPRSTDDDAGKSLMISSAVTLEGKTSVAANLAVAAARVGLYVILVDADLRNPRLSDMVGVGGSAGLSDVLASGDSVDDHLLDVGIDNVRILPGGSVPPNPGELLASPAAHQLLNHLRAHCDLLILDTAPVLPVADSLELVPHVDLVMLVARNRVSRLRNVAAAVSRIKQVGGVISGAVFNDVDRRDSGFSDGYQRPVKATAVSRPVVEAGAGATSTQGLLKRKSKTR